MAWYDTYSLLVNLNVDFHTSYIILAYIYIKIYFIPSVLCFLHLSHKTPQGSGKDEQLIDLQNIEDSVPYYMGKQNSWDD